MAYAQIRDYAKSVQLFQLLDETKANSSLTLTPQASIAYAIALNATAKPEAAQKQLEAALVNSPDNATLHDALGSMLAQQQRYDEAGIHIQRAISLDPTLASAHYILAPFT